ncbi:MAG: FadR/GntR family transcriptional regulator [Eubacteriales bacterium]|nr:FadR/GntR family transcriptional regulator [Eubacteriales bacterium]
MGIEPIKKVNVNEQVFEQMKQQLINGEWKPGQKLPSENELSAMFNVSRVTIRNALQKLAILGLIETYRGEGSFVAESSLGNCLNLLVPTAYLNDSILEIQEFRLMVEPGAASVAAKRASDEDVADLRNRLTRMRSLEEDLYALAQEDFAFHDQIGHITGNSLMIRTYSILTDVLRTSMEKVVAHMGPDAGYYYHSQIVEAIATHDSAGAYDIMRRHIETNIEQYMEH